MARTPGPQNNKPQKPSHEEIAKRAAQIYEQGGCKPGRDIENRLADEDQLIKNHILQNKKRKHVKPNFSACCEKYAGCFLIPGWRFEMQEEGNCSKVCVNWVNSAPKRRICAE